MRRALKSAALVLCLCPLLSNLFWASAQNGAALSAQRGPTVAPGVSPISNLSGNMIRPSLLAPTSPMGSLSSQALGMLRLSDSPQLALPPAAQAAALSAQLPYAAEALGARDGAPNRKAEAAESLNALQAQISDAQQGLDPRAEPTALSGVLGRAFENSAWGAQGRALSIPLPTLAATPSGSRPLLRSRIAPSHPSEPVAGPSAPARFWWGRRLLDWWVSRRLFPKLFLRIPTRSPKLSAQQRAEVKSLIRPGDLLVDSNDELPLWKIFHRVVDKSGAWTHIALYVGDGNIIEVGSKTNPWVVGPISLDHFMDTYHLAVLRPHYQTPEDVQAAIEFVRRALREARRYDAKFNLADQTAYYCGKLLYYALLNMPHPIRVSPRKTMGRLAVLPISFMESPDIDTVWSSGSSFWKSLASHWP